MQSAQTVRWVLTANKQRNIPALRFGNISQMPLEPIEQRRNSGSRLQESFLVEARAISGYSGSPVFLLLLRSYSRQSGKWPENEHGDVTRLLGIVQGYIKNWEPVSDEKGNPIPNKWQVGQNTGMMGVVPAWKLKEVLDLNQVKDHMKRVEEAHHNPTGLQTTGLEF